MKTSQHGRREQQRRERKEARRKAKRATLKKADRARGQTDAVDSQGRL